MFTRLQRRTLIVSAGVAVGYALAFDRIHSGFTPETSPLVYHGSRGPFEGRKVGDLWLAERPKSQFSSGETALWQALVDLPPSDTLVGEMELWCSGRQVQYQDVHLTDPAARPGWSTFAIEIPQDVSGECEIRRSLSLINAEGSQIGYYRLPTPISLRVVPP